MKSFLKFLAIGFVPSLLTWILIINLTSVMNPLLVILGLPWSLLGGFFIVFAALGAATNGEIPIAAQAMSIMGFAWVFLSTTINYSLLIRFIQKLISKKSNA